MASAESTPQAKTAISPQELESVDESTDRFSRLLSVRTRALRQAAELRRFAEDARDVDDELYAFFEHCAYTQTEQATEAQQLLSSRATSNRGEAVTAAAFAVGDGATDADVSPSNERRSVHVWPGQ